MTSIQTQRKCCAGVASVVPAALLVLLPKCPLCFVAWLTVTTGVSLPAVSASWLRGGILLLWVALVAPIFWRRLFRRSTLDAPARQTGSAQSGRSGMVCHTNSTPSSLFPTPAGSASADG
jgi:membrane protein implicated in regulation of membrane protease activity